jgi:hypothetical protein
MRLAIISSGQVRTPPALRLKHAAPLVAKCTSAGDVSHLASAGNVALTLRTCQRSVNHLLLERVHVGLRHRSEVLRRHVGNVSNLTKLRLRAHRQRRNTSNHLARIWRELLLRKFSRKWQKRFAKKLLLKLRH